MVILESHVISLVFILFRKCICLHGRLLVIFGMACAVPSATDGDVTRLFLGLFDGKGFVFANGYCVIECASVFCVSSVYYGRGCPQKFNTECQIYFKINLFPPQLYSHNKRADFYIHKYTCIIRIRMYLEEAKAKQMYIVMCFY